MKTNDLDKIKLLTDAGILGIENRRVNLITTIDLVVGKQICEAIDILNRVNKKQKIELVIDSPGGKAAALPEMMASMVYSVAPIHGLVKGMCASAAFDLLQLCKTRKTVEWGEFMFHAPGYNWEPGDDYLFSYLDGLRSEGSYLHQFILQLLAKRSNQTFEQLQEYSIEEKMFDAFEARKFGFIDEIVYLG